MYQSSRLNILFSNINIVNLLFGFSLVTSLFFSNQTKELTTVVTIPFRAFSLILAMIVIALNGKNFKNITKSATILIFFYISYILKISFSLVTDDFSNYTALPSIYFISSIFMVLIPLLSILVSSQHLEFNKILKLSFYTVLISLVLTLIKSNLSLQQSVDERIDGNIALNTITYGHLGTSLAILSLYFLQKSFLTKIIAIFTFILGVYVAIISGSRSPILALLICFGVFILNFSKNKLLTFLIFIAFALSIFFYWGNYMKIIDGISHTTYSRINVSIESGDTGNRNIYFESAWDQFLASPVFGDNFVIKKGLAAGDYPHNLILESLLALGIIGGALLFWLYFKAVIISIKAIKNKASYNFIALLFIQYVVASLLHGSLWAAGSFIILLGFFLNLRYQTHINFKYKFQIQKKHIQAIKKTEYQNTVLNS